MKVLIPRQDRPLQVECPTCHAVIEYYETEVQEWLVPPMRSGRHLYRGLLGRHIVCPECLKNIMLDAEE